MTMNDRHGGGQVKRFRVKVGHTTLMVEGRTPEEAIREARRRLCLEMPRMWDVIAAMDEDRFEVVPAA